MELYQWQKNCLRAWEESRFRGIVHAVTGSGKTLLALSAIDLLRERCPDLRVRIVVPTVALAQQWKTALLHHAPTEALRPGFFGGSVQDDPDRATMLYIINSARGALAAHIRRDITLRRHILLICDEYHHYQAPQNRRIFDFLTPEATYGDLFHSLALSATPHDAGEDTVLTQALGREIYRYDFDTAARDGVVSPFTVCEVSASFLPDEMRAYGELSDQITRLTSRLLHEYPQLKHLEKERFIREVSAIAHASDMDPEEPAPAFLLAAYRRKEVSNLARARVQCGLSILRRLSPSDRVLIFCERIEQANGMANAIRRRGDDCGIYHSSMTKDARLRNLREFRDGTTRILVSCRSLDEGLDVPESNVGIVLSSTAAERQRIQRLGRILRTSRGKDAACLYYIYIRESSEDAAYLPGLKSRRSFGLRYFPTEDAFSNDLYEYAAGELLSRAEHGGLTQNQLRELRSCLMTGLTRADYLLPPEVLERRAAEARRTGERNYWNAMKAVGAAFRADSAACAF